MTCILPLYRVVNLKRDVHFRDWSQKSYEMNFEEKVKALSLPHFMTGRDTVDSREWIWSWTSIKCGPFFLLFYVVRWHEDTLTFTYLLTRVHKYSRMELFRSCSLWGLNVAPYISEQPSCGPVSKLNKMKFSIINQSVCVVRNVSTVWKTEGMRWRGSGFLCVKTG